MHVGQRLTGAAAAGRIVVVAHTAAQTPQTPQTPPPGMATPQHRRRQRRARDAADAGAACFPRNRALADPAIVERARMLFG